MFIESHFLRFFSSFASSFFCLVPVFFLFILYLFILVFLLFRQRSLFVLSNWVVKKKKKEAILSRVQSAIGGIFVHAPTADVYGTLQRSDFFICFFIFLLRDFCGEGLKKKKKK